MKAFSIALAYFLLAVVLSVIINPIGFIITMFYKGRTQYLNACSEQINRNGNVISGRFFNLTLIKKGSYQFGYCREYISSVLGKNKQSNNLTRTGKFIDKILNLFQKNHCIRQIQNF